MKNFYYVLSFNLMNPRIKSMLSRLKITEMMDSILDLKSRSKFFLSFSEATIHVHTDIEKKLNQIYPEKDNKDHKIRHVQVVNPAFMLPSNSLMQSIAERFGKSSLDSWDENCCSVIFFAEINEDDDDDEAQIDPNSWMVKYELFVTDDMIELFGNGDFVFSPVNVPRSSFTSTYH